MIKLFEYAKQKKQTEIDNNVLQDKLFKKDRNIDNREQRNGKFQISMMKSEFSSPSVGLSTLLDFDQSSVYHKDTRNFNKFVGDYSYCINGSDNNVRNNLITLKKQQLKNDVLQMKQKRKALQCKSRNKHDKKGKNKCGIQKHMTNKTQLNKEKIEFDSEYAEYFNQLNQHNKQQKSQKNISQNSFISQNLSQQSSICNMKIQYKDWSQQEDQYKIYLKKQIVRLKMQKFEKKIKNFNKINMIKQIRIICTVEKMSSKYLTQLKRSSFYGWKQQLCTQLKRKYLIQTIKLKVKQRRNSNLQTQQANIKRQTQQVKINFNFQLTG